MAGENHQVAHVYVLEAFLWGLPKATELFQRVAGKQGGVQGSF
jgi:hypothetical protein